MTKKEPMSRKEKARFKAESEVQAIRAKAIEILVADNGKPDKERRSFREIGRMYNKSQTWVADIAKKCLTKKKLKRNGLEYTKYCKNSNYRQLLARGKRGPVPGTYSQKRIDATKEILEIKRQNPKLGAAKINAMTG